MNKPPVWLFDLDDTLHWATPHVFQHIDRAMTAYIAEHVGVSLAQADALRLHYWHTHGATLRGLRLFHPHINPQHFLSVTHDIPALHRILSAERGLKAVLQRLPGRKILFTNSPLCYAQAVLSALHIAPLFEGVAAIDTLNYQPKPFVSAYQQVLKQFSLNAQDCIMVEDNLHNLKTAKQLGMRTVWLRPKGRNHPAADVQVRQLRQLLQHGACFNFCNRDTP